MNEAEKGDSGRTADGAARLCRTNQKGLNQTGSGTTPGPADVLARSTSGEMPTAPETEPRPCVPSRRDQRHVWEVRPIPGRVPRDQRQLLDLRVGTDIEIRQRRGTRRRRAGTSKPAPPTSRPRTAVRPAEHARVEPPVELARAGERRCELRIDDGIDEHRPAPLPPLVVPATTASTLRQPSRCRAARWRRRGSRSRLTAVRAMTWSVVTPGLAAPARRQPPLRRALRGRVLVDGEQEPRKSTTASRLASGSCSRMRTSSWVSVLMPGFYPSIGIVPAP